MAIIDIEFKISKNWTTNVKEKLIGEVRKTMQKSVKTATDSVKKFVPKSSGATRDSIQGNLIRGQDSFSIKVFSTGTAKKYFHILDKGRVAGMQRTVYPRDRLIAWMRRKGKVTSQASVSKLANYIASTSKPGLGIAEKAEAEALPKIQAAITLAMKEFHRRMMG
ncbi:MAG: hypothetical protein Q8P20_01245 [bacterium]|nr:hypothetical protein [bacterium]